MTERPIRDILGEVLRRERYPFIRPTWREWDGPGQEEVRRRADHVMRMLAGYGVELIRTSDPFPPAPEPESLVIYRWPIAGNKHEGVIRTSAERMIRKAAGDAWEIVAIVDGAEKVEQSFSIEQALLNGGLVLTDHPDLRSVLGLGKQLAAVNEIFRLNAEGMQGPA
jgi:hypothetical protein